MSSSLSAHDLKRAREIFDSTDADGSGAIDAGELGAAMAAMGTDLDDDQIEALLEKLDSDGDGTISFDEFLEGLAPFLLDAEESSDSLDSDNESRPAKNNNAGASAREARLREIFAQVDTDNSGSVSPDELLALLRKFGHDLSLDDVSGYFSDLGDGSVSGEMSFELFAAELGDLLLGSDGAGDSGGGGGGGGGSSGGLSAAALARAREVFNACDADGSGSVDVAELKVGLAETMGHELGTEEVNALLDHLDSDGDGAVSFEEFAAGLGPLFESQTAAAASGDALLRIATDTLGEALVAQYKEAWDELAGGADSLDTAKLVWLLDAVGESDKTDRASVRSLVATLDPSGSGVFTFSSFLSNMAELKEAKGHSGGGPGGGVGGAELDGGAGSAATSFSGEVTLEAALERLNSLANDNDSLRAKLAAQSKQFNDLKETARTSTDYAHRLEDELSEAQAKLKELTGESGALAELTAAKTQLLEQLAGTEAELATFKEANESLTADLAEAKSGRKELTATMKSLSERLESEEETVRKLERELKDARAAASGGGSEQVAVVSAELSKAQEQLEEFEVARDVHTAEITALKKKLADTEGELATLKSTKGGERAEAFGDGDDLSDALASGGMSVVDVHMETAAERDRLKDRVAQLEGELAELNSTLTDTKAVVADQASQLEAMAALKAKNKELEEETAAANAKAAEAAAAQAAAETAAKHAQDQVAATEATFAQLGDQMTADLEAANAQVAALKAGGSGGGGGDDSTALASLKLDYEAAKAKLLEAANVINTLNEAIKAEKKKTSIAENALRREREGAGLSVDTNKAQAAVLQGTVAELEARATEAEETAEKLAAKLQKAKDKRASIEEEAAEAVAAAQREVDRLSAAAAAATTKRLSLLERIATGLPGVQQFLDSHALEVNQLQESAFTAKAKSTAAAERAAALVVELEEAQRTSDAAAAASKAAPDDDEEARTAAKEAKQRVRQLNADRIHAEDEAASLDSQYKAEIGRRDALDQETGFLEALRDLLASGSGGGGGEGLSEDAAAQVAALQTRLDAANAAATEAAAAAAEHLGQLSAVRAELAESKEAAAKELNETKAQLAAATTKAAGLATELEATEAQLTAAREGASSSATADAEKAAAATAAAEQAADDAAAARASLTATETKLAAAEARVAELNTQLEEAVAEVAAQKDAAATAAADATAAQEALSAEKAANVAKVAELMSELDLARSAASRADESVLKLHDKVAAAKADAAAATARADAAEASLAKLREELEEVESARDEAVADKNAVLSRATEGKEGAEAALADYAETAAKLRTENKALKKDLAELRDKYDDLEESAGAGATTAAALTAAKDRASELTAELARLEAELARANSKAATVDAKAASLEAELAAVQAAAASATSEKKALANKVAELEGLAEDEMKRLPSLKALAALQEEGAQESAKGSGGGDGDGDEDAETIGSLRGQIELLEGSLTKRMATIERQQRELEAAKEAVADAEAAAAAEKAKRKEAERKAAELTAALESAEESASTGASGTAAALAQVKADLTTANERVTELESQLSAKETAHHTALAELQASLAALTGISRDGGGDDVGGGAGSGAGSRDELAERLAAAEAAAAANAAALADAEAALAKAQSRRKAAEEELAAMASSNSEAAAGGAADLAAAKRKVKELEEQLEDSAASVGALEAKVAKYKDKLEAYKAAAAEEKGGLERALESSNAEAARLKVELDAANEAVGEATAASAAASQAVAEAGSSSASELAEAVAAVEQERAIRKSIIDALAAGPDALYALLDGGGSGSAGRGSGGSGGDGESAKAAAKVVKREAKHAAAVEALQGLVGERDAKVAKARDELTELTGAVESGDEAAVARAARLEEKIADYTARYADDIAAAEEFVTATAESLAAAREAAAQLATSEAESACGDSGSAPEQVGGSGGSSGGVGDGGNSSSSTVVASALTASEREGLTAAADSVAGLEAKVAKEKSRRKEAEGYTAELTAEADAMKEKATKEKARRKEAEAVQLELTDEADALREKVAKEKAKRKDAEAAAAEAAAEADRLAAKVEKEKAKRKELEGSIATLTADLEEAEAAVAREKEKRKAATEASDNSGAVEAVEAELAELTAKYKDQKTATAAAEGRAADAEACVVELQARVSELEARVSELQAALSAAKDELNELSQASASAKAREEEGAAAATAAEAAEELASETKARKAAEAQVEELSARVAELEGSLAAANEALTRAEAAATDAAAAAASAVAASAGSGKGEASGGEGGANGARERKPIVVKKVAAKKLMRTKAAEISHAGEVIERVLTKIQAGVGDGVRIRAATREAFDVVESVVKLFGELEATVEEEAKAAQLASLSESLQRRSEELAEVADALVADPSNSEALDRLAVTLRTLEDTWDMALASCEASAVKHDLREAAAKVPLFSGCEIGFFNELVRKMVERVFKPKQFIIRAGETGTSMFFVTRGTCDVLVGSTKVAQMEEGAFFGEIAVLIKGKRTASIRASTYVEAYELDKSALLNALRIFPEYKDRILKVGEERLLDDLRKERKRNQAINIRESAVNRFRAPLLLRTRTATEQLHAVESSNDSDDPGANAETKAAVAAAVEALAATAEELDGVVELECMHGRIRPALRTLRDSVTVVTATKKLARRMTVDQVVGHVNELEAAATWAICASEMRAALAKVPLFKGLDQGFRDALLRGVNVVEYAEGEEVITCGSNDTSMYFIVEGTVSVILPSGERIGNLCQGEYFGENGLRANAARTASVVANQALILCSLDKSVLDSVLESQPAVREVMEANIADESHVMEVERLKLRKQFAESLSVADATQIFGEVHRLQEITEEDLEGSDPASLEATQDILTDLLNLIIHCREKAG